MQAEGTHRYPWCAIGISPGLLRVPVDDKSINAFAESPIAVALHSVRVKKPLLSF